MAESGPWGTIVTDEMIWSPIRMLDNQEPLFLEVSKSPRSELLSLCRRLPNECAPLS